MVDSSRQIAHRGRLRSVRALSAGIAGEHIACARLWERGVRAFRVDQDAPYDILAQVGDKFLRIQVKSATVPQRRAGVPSAPVGYMFNCGQGPTRKSYAPGAFDLFACVGVHEAVVAWFTQPELARGVFIRSPSDVEPTRSTSRTFHTLTWEAALRALALGPRDLTDDRRHSWLKRVCTHCKMEWPKDRYYYDTGRDYFWPKCKQCLNRAKRARSEAVKPSDHHVDCHVCQRRVRIMRRGNRLVRHKTAPDGPKCQGSFSKHMLLNIPPPTEAK